MIARKIGTPLSLSIDPSCCWAAAASPVISNPLNAFYILCQRLHFCCWSIVLVFLCRRLRCCCGFLRPVIFPPSPPLLSLIPRTHRIFCVRCQRLSCRRGLLKPVFLRHRHRCHGQFPGPVNTLPPLSPEMFTQARCLFCFLWWCLCRRRFLRFVFLCRCLCPCRQFLRPVIATPRPPLLYPNYFRLSCRLRSLGRVFYSSSSADTSVAVVDSTSQPVWHRQLSLSCRSLKRIVSNFFPSMPMLSLPIPWARLPLPTLTLWSKTLSEILLPFGLLALYFV